MGTVKNSKQRSSKQKRKKTRTFLLLLFILSLASLYFFSTPILTSVANLIIVDDVLEHADGVVVLNTGVEIYPRLQEAADIYSKGLADKVVINGNRKNEAMKQLEQQGYVWCCPWDEDRIRILVFLGVNREDIISISAPDAYDSVSEAAEVATVLAGLGMKRLIIATSKTHTARSIHIWRSGHGKQFSLQSAAAKNDPFSAGSWWQNGKDIRWVLHEYGAWLYCYWKKLI